jgi:hypothetical protein
MDQSEKKLRTLKQKASEHLTTSFSCERMSASASQVSTALQQVD